MTFSVSGYMAVNRLLTLHGVLLAIGPPGTSVFPVTSPKGNRRTKVESCYSIRYSARKHKVTVSSLADILLLIWSPIATVSMFTIALFM